MMTDDKTISTSLSSSNPHPVQRQQSVPRYGLKDGILPGRIPERGLIRDRPDVVTSSFLIPSFRGQPVQQQNMYAEFVVEDFWVDLHIRKSYTSPPITSYLAQLVRSVKFDSLAANAPKNQLKETTGRTLRSSKRRLNPTSRKRANVIRRRRKIPRTGCHPSTDSL